MISCHSFRILRHFNTTEEEYSLIFTSGATAALKLVAEHFDWNPGQGTAPGDPTAHSKSEENTTAHSSSEGDTKELQNKSQHCKQNEKEGKSSPGAFVYVQENHTSALGMRGPAHEAGCDVYCLTTTEARELLKEDITNNTDTKEGFATGRNDGSSRDDSNVTKCYNDPKNSIPASFTTESCSVSPHKSQGRGRRNCLFVYSGQCNFSGSKAPMQWIKRVQGGALNGLLSVPPINSQPTGNNTQSRGWWAFLHANSL